MTTSLKAIIEKSYDVFSPYKVSKPLDVCTVCCMTEDEENRLISLGVRFIPFDLLYSYNTAAKTAKPNIDEFKHFLPRFLELTAEFQYLSHSVELTFGRFDYYGESEWTPPEKELLSEFAVEFFRYCLSVYPLPDFEKIDSILVMLSKAYIDIDKILSLWMEKPARTSLLHFNDLIQSGNKQHRPFHLNNPFDHLNLSDKIARWLNATNFDQSFTDVIEEMIMNPENLEESTLRDLSWTYDIIKMKIPF